MISSVRIFSHRLNTPSHCELFLSARIDDKCCQCGLSRFINCQGEKMDIGGYYHPDHEKSNKLMRPSQTFNGLL